MQNIDYEAWRFWLGILQFVGTIVIGVYVWWTNREKVNRKRFAQLEADVKKRLTAEALKEVEKARDVQCEKHQVRTTELEHSLRSMPNRSEIAGLSEEINHLTNKLGRLEGRLDGLNRVADLINEFLINQGGSK